MNIALDVYGGDRAPLSNIEGACNYIKDYADSAANIFLVGDKDHIESTLNSISIQKSNIHIVHAPQKVNMNERSARIFKEKPNSSLVKSIKLVQTGDAHAVVSAGNTGALMASSLFLIGKIPGIRRPAFAPYIPSNKGGFILCDAGANVDAKPQHLVQFALMAGAYMEHLENRPNPRVALLNIGLEKNKGNDLTIRTYPLLKEYINNFIGNIESRYIMEGKADIVICDGFTGNIVLKLAEGIISHIMLWINGQNENKSQKNTYLVSDIILKNITDTLDHEEHGATPLLGINGIVMKCHGSSTARGIKNSLIAAQKAVEQNLIENIADRLSKHTDIFEDSVKVSETNPV